MLGLLHQLPLLAVLVVLWMLLWGDLSVLSVLTGVLLAIGVTRVFYLPAVALSGRFHVLAFAKLMAVFLADLVRASAQVASQALSPRGVRASAVVEVSLRSRSDFIVTLTAVITSLVPGSLVLEVDRERGVLFIHVLGATSQGDLDEARAHVLANEALLIRALGSRRDFARLRAKKVISR
jgi:multicomponent Na+:H+ antiporter subunit E